jgi:hypothetical protein
MAMYSLELVVGHCKPSLPQYSTGTKALCYFDTFRCLFKNLAWGTTFLLTHYRLGRILTIW